VRLETGLDIHLEDFQETNQMLLTPGSICQITIGSTSHTLRVFLRVKDGIDEAPAEREFTAWLSGRVLQDVYDDLRSKINSGQLETFQNEVPFNWYRDCLFAAWLLDTGRAVSVMAERALTDTSLVAACNKYDDGDWVGQVRPLERCSEISSVSDTDPSSPDLARWRKIQEQSQARKGLH
jgi:hypothetical protein